ncbi:hypothetical protein Bcep18194_B2260 [Burkholderia lata]|uniref:Uncharacterized protein n=1 Tax=Burkholderia lata (strain ATCC 17760 / DSM 23089 / LMG 22485 / NCIMB 9086 / R18194 / 383) TaxID=482957 RepID=Q393J5_BURL3|nr:hypothetical protein Bcep18194_B2260 [Burkholderia lata]
MQMARKLRVAGVSRKSAAPHGTLPGTPVAPIHTRVARVRCNRCREAREKFKQAFHLHFGRPRPWVPGAVRDTRAIGRKP